MIQFSDCGNSHLKNTNFLITKLFENTFLILTKQTMYNKRTKKLLTYKMLPRTRRKLTFQDSDDHLYYFCCQHPFLSTNT